ncbi:hypothetical protein [Rhodovulum strictum]|uniref:Uncharacterized protein n=1 Tax=Rhodovulum strictum TaxID=58314 RepID=A0A844BHP1_9RHOB|nr:hypothetical protein [Rhodovulum strictum]MRH22089.1 hypothetical protein [Rhodovulum strictum]
MLTVLLGTGVLCAWGISFPVLIGAGGVALFAMSLQALLATPAAERQVDPAQIQAAAVPLIFALAFPGIETKLGILAMVLGMVGLNWILILRAKAIMRMIGPVPLQLLGLVFGVLQFAVALEFMRDAMAIL